MPTATKASPAKAVRPAKAKAAVPAQPSAGPPPASPPEPPRLVRLVHGKRVVSDEPMASNLKPKPGHPPVPIHSIRLFTLEDGSTVNGCRDCEETGTVGEIRAHRIRAHGTAKPGRKPATVELPVHIEMTSMTIAELFELVRDAGEWGERLAALEDKAAQWRDRALAAESWKRKVTARLAQLGFKLDEDDD